jgi:hypothetical protein
MMTTIIVIGNTLPPASSASSSWSWSSLPPVAVVLGAPPGLLALSCPVLVAVRALDGSQRAPRRVLVAGVHRAACAFPGQSYPAARIGGGCFGVAWGLPNTLVGPSSLSLAFLELANVWLVLGGRMSEAYGFVE